MFSVTNSKEANFVWLNFAFN